MYAAYSGEPMNYRESLARFHILKNKGIFDKEHVDEVLDAVSLKSDKGTPVDGESKWFLLDDFHLNFGMFAIPSWEWVEPFSDLLKGKRVLELGAGTGIITAMLRRLGINIDAVDNNERELEPLVDMVVCDGIEYLRQHKDDYDVLFMSWPEMNDTCRNACDLFFDKGKEVFYLGEYYDGCTANAAFFNAYDLECLDIPYRPVYDLHDYLYRVVEK